MSSIGNYNKDLNSFDKGKFIKSLEFKLANTDNDTMKNAIKLKLKALKHNKTVTK